MTMWIEKLTGSLEQKKQYRRNQARLDALPEPYGSAPKALQRYFMYNGGIVDGETLLTMQGDFVDLVTPDIQAKIDTLNKVSQEMGAAVYAAAAEQGESGDVPGAEASDGDQPATDAGDDDVVDAEVVEDDEEKK